MNDVDGFIIWEKDDPNDEIWWGTIYHGINEKDLKLGKVTNEKLDEAVWCDDDEIIFSFDKKKVFRLFRDYPEALTTEEKVIFDKENPFWAKFFRADEG